MSNTPDTPSAPTPARRPWYRLHAITVVAGLLATAVMVILIVPGECESLTFATASVSTGCVERYGHGWPWTFHCHVEVAFQAVLQTKQMLPHWFHAKAWRLEGPIVADEVVWLWADIAVAIGIVAVTIFVVEVSRRRRLRIGNVSLRELLLAVVLFALTFSWIRGHQALARTEDELNWTIGDGGRKRDSWEVSDCAPDWLARLTGRDRAMFRHIVEGHCSSNSAVVLPQAASTLPYLHAIRCDDEKVVPKSIASLASCPRLEELSLDHVRLNAEMFEAIASISTLRKLNFGYCRHIETTDLAALKRLRNLREINYVSDTWNKGPLLERLSVLEDLESLELGDLFSSDDSVGLAPLAKLKRLRRFKIGKYAIDDDLVHLATLCRLDSVSLVGASVNGSGLRHLVGLPLLRELDLRDCPIKDDALDWIVQMPQLERLELSESDITDAGLLRLQRLRNLKYLSIAQTHTSEAARKDCRDAMPRTEVWIGWP